MVLDAPPDRFEEVLPEAEAQVRQALSRRLTPGYFFSPQPAEAITPYHSGNTGLHLGRVESLQAGGRGPVLPPDLEGRAGSRRSPPSPSSNRPVSGWPLP